MIDKQYLISEIDKLKREKKSLTEFLSREEKTLAEIRENHDLITYYNGFIDALTFIITEDIHP